MYQMKIRVPLTTQTELEQTLKLHGLFTPQIQKAIKQAIKSHAGQKRDDGSSYVEQHVFPITLNILNRYKKNYEIETLLIVALLHDVLEDDPSFSFGDCEKEFGTEIAEYIRPLTKVYKQKPTTQQEKFEFNKSRVEHIKKAQKISQIVKLEDRLNNVLCIRQVGNTPKYERYLKETQELFIPLAQQVSDFYVKALEKQIARLNVCFQEV
jgi:(p)ppGpp synthase/HD superfamily hydrolase